MKKLIATAVFLLIAPGWLPAGNSENPVQGEAYFFAGPIYRGGPAPAHGGFITGMGAEILFYKGLGVDADAGYVRGPTGTGAIDFAYHFLSKGKRKVEPFALGGYSIYSPGGTAEGGWNLGGGVNY